MAVVMKYGRLLPFLSTAHLQVVAAVGRPPHFFKQAGMAALCQDAATPVS